MPLRKIVISLDGPERNALAGLAERERRDLRDQAAIIIRKDLEGRGLLPKPEHGDPARITEVPHAQPA